MSQRTPKVFVSSTVYDFRDLRSALKFWLEQYGFEVLLSELNDFPQLPDRNSYESCLKAIDRSDYFILLIGSRVGGWYNRDERLSITRMEYRHAYARFCQGKLRLLVLVRKEIWDVREDRQALRRFLEDEDALDRELSSEDKARLVNHPSEFVNNADFVMDFLREVGRIEEMKAAVTGASDFPRGNWIYQFASFREIVDACRGVLDLSGDLRQKALRENVKHEIKMILRELLHPHKDVVRPATSYSQFARRSFRGAFADSSTYKGSHLVWLSMFLFFHANAGKRLRVSALQEAITSGEFLDFDTTTGTHTVGPLQTALIDLDGQIHRLRNFDGLGVSKATSELVRALGVKNNLSGHFTVANEESILAFAIHDVIENIVVLCRAIHVALQGDMSELATLTLNPSSPLTDESEKIAHEHVSLDDVGKWLTSS